MSQPSKTERAANLFDLRRIIGGLFVCWGVLLVILALVGMGDVDNAENINLFAGLGMLAFGIVMLLWAFTRPLAEELEEAGGSGGSDGEGTVGPGDAGRE